MQKYQIGQAVMVASKKFPEEFDEEAQIKLLPCIGEDVLTAIRVRKEKGQSE